jgi:hypothetical protein
MKKILLVLWSLLLVSTHSFSQNSFPTTGNALIKDAYLLVQSKLSNDPLLILDATQYSHSLMRFRSTYYQSTVGIIDYDFQIESDGLKIKENGNKDYTFQKGGHFIVSRGNLLIGTDKSTDASGITYKLNVNGKIRANEVKVYTGWADFVFAPNYRLRPLSEVESFIKANGHLPEIPSAKEVEADGVNIGETQSKLLQKIEELTLYLIEQNKKLEEQNKKLEEQNKKIEVLEEKIKQK